MKEIGIAIVLIVLAVGLGGPPLLTWKINQLIDKYNAIDDHQDAP